MASRSFNQIYQRLLRAYGPQHWWPANTLFEVMIGAILTQNTSWMNVERAIENLKRERALTAKAINQLSHAHLARLLTPVGYFNVKATRLQNFCRWYMEQGSISRLQRVETIALRERLLSVNGVGPETADDILLYAFERPVFVIDAYTRRLFARLELITGNESYEDLRSLFERRLSRVHDKVTVFNEFHALIVLHAKLACRRQPSCLNCCLRRSCPGAAVSLVN